MIVFQWLDTVFIGMDVDPPTEPVNTVKTVVSGRLVSYNGQRF